MATLNAIALRCLTDAGWTTSNSAFVTIVERWVNEACRDIMSLAQWPFRYKIGTITTVASTAVYVIPAVAQEIQWMRIPATEQPIFRTTEQALANSGIDIEMLGTPTNYYVNQANPATTNFLELGLWPVPSAVLSISYGYLLTWTDLTTAQDISLVGLLPSDFEPAIQHAVMSKMALDNGDPALFQVEEKKYAMQIAKQKSNYLNQTDETFRRGYVDVPRRVRRMPGFPGDHYSNDY